MKSYASEVRRIAGGATEAPAHVRYALPTHETTEERIATPTAAEPDPLLARLRRLDPRAYFEVFRKESLAFKMACIYLLIEYVRPQTIYPFLDVLPWGIASLVGGVAIVMFSAAERRAKPYGSQMGLLLALLCLIVVSILASQYPDYGWANLPLFLSWMMAYFLITKAVNNERRYMFFFVLFLLFSFKMSQHGLKIWASSGFRFNKEGVNGAPGWFQNSGEVGIQMCVFIPMLLYFLFAGWKDWSLIKRLIVLGVVVTAIGTVIGSSSRGALIGTVVVLLWMLLLSKYKFRGFMAVGAVVAIIALVLPPEFYGRLNEMGDDNSSVMRMTYWIYGWGLMKEHPLLGVGYYNEFPSYAAYLISIGESRAPQVCHNIFVQAGSELGFTGFGLVLAVIVMTFVLNARSRKALKQQLDAGFLTRLCFGLDGAMIGYLISAQFVTVLYYPYLWIDLALVVALHNVVRRRIPGAAAQQARNY